MIEVGRRGFITGLAALVAAPAVVGVAPLMPISTRFAPLYVPINWVADIAEVYNGAEWRDIPNWLNEENVARAMACRRVFEEHAWPRPLAAHWVNMRDHDPGFVRALVKRFDEENERNWFGMGRGVDVDERAQTPRAGEGPNRFRRAAFTREARQEDGELAIEAQRLSRARRAPGHPSQSMRGRAGSRFKRLSLKRRT
jgi:hypothetical protein